MQTKQRMTPRTTRTLEQVCKLKRDNLDTPGYWILVDQHEVHIHAQRAGESSTAQITIPKRDFNKLVDFYNGVQK